MIHAGKKLTENADYVLFLRCRDLYITQKSPKKTFHFFNEYRKNKDI